jgi:polyphenol oxidase
LFIVPSWPAPAGVRAMCSTRAGGVSRAPYDSLNLGAHVGDDAECVARNRAVYSATLGARPVFLEQVHGTQTIEIGADTPDGTQADGCFTTHSHVACTMMVADCMPVLFTAADGSVVGAAHAGWRGLAGQGGLGILESVWGAIENVARATNAVQVRSAMVWLGPCIGPDAFEVGDEVKAAFESSHPDAAAMFKALRPGKWLADLPGLARLRLQALGIANVYGNDGSREWCTASNPSIFFSHRRDRVSGRFAASIWRT